MPTAEAKANAAKMRAPYRGKGIYQIGREKKKESLMNHLATVYNMSKKDAEILVYGVPNAKFGWYNRVIKDIQERDPKNEINVCDAALVENMWAAEGFTTAFADFIKNNNINRTTTKEGHKNYPTRGNIPVSCRGGQLVTNFKNPGMYNYETGGIVTGKQIGRAHV